MTSVCKRRRLSSTALWMCSRESPASFVPGPIAPGTTLTFTVGYSRTDLIPGVYDGKVFLGPPEAPALVSLPMRVTYGAPTPEPTNTPAPCLPDIRDVPRDNWAWPDISNLYCRGVLYGYIETAAHYGIADGYADGSFRPVAPITRAQVAKLIVRASTWPAAPPAPPRFRDVPPSHWAYSYITQAAAHGVLSGYADGTFAPDAPATRAQLAKIVYLLLQQP